jgi:hypothetical protein
MKQIKWETNFNGKLSNKVFFHLDIAPSTGIAESKMPQEIEIITKDNSGSGEYYLLYFIRLKMQNIVDTLSLLSHGKPAVEFIREKMDADKRINWQTEMALYAYSADENIKDFFVPIPDNNIDNN